jgi:hypothetical protein
VSYRTETVTCYRTEWREQQVPIQVQRVSCRTEVDKVPITVQVPQYFDQTVKTYYTVRVPRVIVRDVSRCVLVPVTSVDPCTGCCYTTCCPQWITQQVSCTVYDCVQQSRDVVVKACRLVPEQRVIDRVRYVPVTTTETVMTCRRYCVQVPYQVQVCVPVLVPCCPSCP